jgi:haloalkane dehalogenase
MKALRTPDDRFETLSGYDFEPNYETIADGEGAELRVHYLDEGPADGDIVLLLHGEPSWSYLYRHMIPPLVSAGHRVIAPDLVGFGRSDKPTERTDYTYARHVEWMREFVFDKLDLTGITLFCQDWGGLIGLRLVAAHPERFDRVVASNTMIPSGDHHPGDAFNMWLDFSQNVDVFPTGAIINGATTTDLSDEVMAAYDAPFPDESYKAGARVFPALVPVTPDNPESDANRRAIESLATFDKPFLCAFGDSDPVLGGQGPALAALVEGSAGQPHTTVENGGHFIQEDCGPELARITNEFIAATN